jgi:hypothetical protein
VRAADLLGGEELGFSIADFNGDQYLDIYIGGYDDKPGYAADAMWFNNGDGTFSHVWNEPISMLGGR